MCSGRRWVHGAVAACALLAGCGGSATKRAVTTTGPPPAHSGASAAEVRYIAAYGQLVDRYYLPPIQPTAAQARLIAPWLRALRKLVPPPRFAVLHGYMVHNVQQQADDLRQFDNARLAQDSAAAAIASNAFTQHHSDMHAILTSLGRCANSAQEGRPSSKPVRPCRGARTLVIIPTP